MSFEIQWDTVPAKRQKKVEKYSTPVLTLVAVDPEKKGAGRKMIFNKAAQEALGVVGEDRVSFGFAKATKQVFLKKAVAPQGFELTKTCTLSDKKTFEFILENFGLNEELENEFDIVASAVAPGAMELVAKSSFETSVEFENRELGEITDEANISGDLSGIPATPEGGVQYTEAVNTEASTEEVELTDASTEPKEEVEMAHTPGTDLAPEKEDAAVDPATTSEEDEW